MTDKNVEKCTEGSEDGFRPPVLSLPEAASPPSLSEELAEIVSGVRDRAEGVVPIREDRTALGVMKMADLENLDSNQISTLLEHLRLYNVNKLQFNIHGHNITIYNTQSLEVPLRVDFSPRKTSRERENTYFFDKNGQVFKPVPADPVYSEIMELPEFKQHKDSFAFIKIEDLLRNIQSVTPQEKERIIKQVQANDSRFQVYFADFEDQSMLLTSANPDSNPNLLSYLSELIEDIDLDQNGDKAA